MEVSVSLWGYLYQIIHFNGIIPEKNQLLGYPDDYGNSMALWQVDPTWWNAKGGLRGERVDLHPLQGPVSHWWQVALSPWRTQLVSREFLDETCSLLLFDAFFWWTSDEQVIQVAKFPMTMCDLENSFGRRGELIKIFRVALAWTFSSSIPMKRSFSSWMTASCVVSCGRSGLWKGPIHSHPLLRLPLTLMLIPLNDLLKQSEGNSWSYLKDEKLWNMLKQQELSDLLNVSETKIFWDIYVSKLEPSIPHSFLRSFAIGVLLSQLPAVFFCHLEILTLRWIVLF